MTQLNVRSLAQSFTSGVWIFGFGSLIWKAEFECSRRVEGYIKGYRRVFFQGSTDHRGTPDAPGRTVTLLEDQESCTWGAAYLLAGSEAKQKETLEHLEWREKQYDLRLRLPVYARPTDADPIVPAALVYVATADAAANSNWLGPAPREDIAQQIATASGPSGPNFVYLFRLAEAVRQAGACEEELEWLERRVKEILKSGEAAPTK